MSRRLVLLGLGLGPASLLIASAEAANRDAEMTLLRACFSRPQLEPSPSMNGAAQQPDTSASALVEEFPE